MNQRREATLHDVARAVGVSSRTVSRVVNNESGFSEATRAKVMEAVDSLGYRPNLLARSLIRGRSATIGLVTTTMTDPFFAELADGVQAAARTVGLTMYFSSTDGDPTRQREVLESLRSHAVDGIIIFPAPGTEAEIAEVCARTRVPTVVIDHHVVGPYVRSVASDIEGGAHLAVNHLRNQGRERIGMIAATESSLRRREAGYRRALAADAPARIARGRATAEGGMEATAELLAASPDVDAIFAYNDLMAMGAIRTLTDHGRAVPDDIAVVGFDDIQVSAMVTPSLTTVHLDRERLGQRALEHLMALRDAPEAEEPPTTLPVELIQRESA